MATFSALFKNVRSHAASGWDDPYIRADVVVATFDAPDTTMIRELSPRIKQLSPNAWIGGIVAGAILLPVLSLLVQPILGVYMTALALATLLIMAIAVPTSRKLAITASVLPVASMVSLSVPVTGTLTRLSVQYAVLLSLGAIYAYMFRDDYPLRKVRTCLKCYMQVLPLMVVIGEALGAVSYGVLRHQYPFKGTPLPIVAAAFIVFAIAEELVFRGLIQRQAAKFMHPVTAAALTVLVYAAATIGTGSLLPAALAIVSGIAISAIYCFIPNLIVTASANITMKLMYVSLIAGLLIK